MGVANTALGSNARSTSYLGEATSLAARAPPQAVTLFQRALWWRRAIFHHGP